MAEKNIAAKSQETEKVLSAQDEQKRLREERKKMREEQKAQRKEAKRRARELDLQQEELEDETEGGSAPIVFVTFIIVVIWLAILALLIKLDVGGFGSTVLRPVLKDIPVINKILPAEKMTGAGDSTQDEYYGYTSLKDAVEQIRRLELELENAQSGNAQTDQRIADLQAEIERLKTFENNQVAFEDIKNEFYDEVIYSDKGPGADAFLKYYESMDPATAEKLYKQVLAQQQVDSQVKDYANAYAEMKPKEAAAIFEAMQDNLDLAAKILETKDASDRGKILGVMDPDVAARLTKIMDPES